jgi:hypothetical protein
MAKFICRCGAALPGLSEWFDHVKREHGEWLEDLGGGRTGLWEAYRVLKEKGLVTFKKG